MLGVPIRSSTELAWEMICEVAFDDDDNDDKIPFYSVIGIVVSACLQDRVRQSVSQVVKHNVFGPESMVRARHDQHGRTQIGNTLYLVEVSFLVLVERRVCSLAHSKQTFKKSLL